MVRVSDARMSGTAGGTVVLHVAPEAAVGGPLARSATATRSSSTCRRGPSTSWCRAELRDAGTLLRCRDRLARGYGWLYAEHVLQATRAATSTSCDGRPAVKQRRAAPLGAAPGGMATTAAYFAGISPQKT